MRIDQYLKTLPPIPRRLGYARIRQLEAKRRSDKYIDLLALVESQQDTGPLLEALEAVYYEISIKRTPPADDYDRGADRARADILRILEDRLESIRP